MDGRNPQSPQSVPRPHAEEDDPGPPSSQIPFVASDAPPAPAVQVSEQEREPADPTTLLVPSHVAPLGQGLHDARVVASPPPDVNHPGRHELHSSAAPVEYLLSAPHFAQTELPAAANLPATQRATTLFPEHALPAAHVLHKARTVSPVPPAVNDPAGHVVHAPLPPVEYLESLPHAVTTLVPPHAYPGWHVVHAVRAPRTPPDVNDPTAQELHVVAWAALNLSSPHTAQEALFARAALPALQGVITLVPAGHSLPAGHGVQASRFLNDPPHV